MSMKKLFCLILAFALMSMAALAEGDLEAQLDAANARIAELEALVEEYKPYYDAQVVVEFDGGIVALDDVMTVYNDYVAMYSSYGIDPAAYGLDGTLKQQAADQVLEDEVLKLKAAELGLDQLDEETLAGVETELDETYQGYVDSVASQMLQAGYDEATVQDEAAKYLEDNGYSKDSLRESIIQSRMNEALHDYTVKDVTLSEEELQAAYDALVEEQKTSFENDNTYTSALSNGDTVVWNPAGYRAVKHVLIQFDDDQTARKTELENTISDLEDELEALNDVEEEVEEEEAEEEAAEEEASEEEAEAADEEEPAEEEAAEDEEAEPVEEVPETEDAEEVEEVVTRSEEEINADIAAAQAEIDALYDELMVTANEVVDKFNAGTDFQALIDEYNSDPGMVNEPTATNGYAVAAESTTWDPGFRDGAMSIANVGEISEPVRSDYGIHIIYYMADIPEGQVALDDVREALSESTLDQKLADTYNGAVDQWIQDVNPVYHYDRIG